MKRKRRFTISLSALSILSIAAAAATAATVCIAIFSSVYSRSLMSDAAVSSEQNIQQTVLAMDNYIYGIKNQLTQIIASMEGYEDPASFSEDIAIIPHTQSDIYAITIYDAQGGIITCAGSSAALKEEIRSNLSFDARLFEAAEDFAFLSPHVQNMFEGEYPWVVTLASEIKTPAFGNARYIAVDFRFSEIARYIDNVGIGRHGYCYITDQEGNIVYHPQQQVIFSGLKQEDSRAINALSDGVHMEKDIIYTLGSTYDELWRIIGVSYTDELEIERRSQIIISVIISFFFCALIAFIVMLLYSKIVNAPVLSLIKAMKRFEKHTGDFHYKGGGETVKELQALSGSFAHMAVTIQNLVETVHQEETALRKTELKALQAQINPHFLYNTLDSIQWMCEQGKNEEATRMVGALARLFRISISKGRELITIKEELNHAENYLIIQSYRYRNQFSYRFDLEPGLENYLCNKITIQPLIENAIYHGLDRMVEQGEIVISVRQAPDDEKDILITVSDNGVGMTPEQCEKILKKERSDTSGIGVKNVNDRLKIYFGEKYGLFIKSELDVGTSVTVRIPKVEKEAAYAL